MVERFDALAHSETEEETDPDRRRQDKNISGADLRGLGSIMYRAATLRANRRAATSTAPQPVPDPVLGGVYLPPSLRRALAALLRGDHVSAAEKAALARAVSLLSSEPIAEEPSRVEGDPWASFRHAANSNLSLAMRVERGHLGAPATAERAVTQNPILHGLGCASDSAEQG